MAGEPRIVAELGRPETPEETADRKAAASATYRSSKSLRNLIAALLVTVGVVAIVVFGVPRGEVAPPPAANVAEAAETASAALGMPVLAPATPEGWRPNSARVEDGTWRIVYAPEDGYVRLAQRPNAEPEWVTVTLDGRAPTGEVTIAGVTWDEYDLSGSDDVTYALATQIDGGTVVIYGATSPETASVLATDVAPEVLAMQGVIP